MEAPKKTTAKQEAARIIARDLDWMRASPVAACNLMQNIRACIKCPYLSMHGLQISCGGNYTK